MSVFLVCKPDMACLHPEQGSEGPLALMKLGPRPTLLGLSWGCLPEAKKIPLGITTSLSSGLLETTVQKVARVKAPNKSLPSAVYCIEDKM